MTDMIAAPNAETLVETLRQFEYQYARLLEGFKNFHSAAEGASQWVRWPLKTYSIAVGSETQLTAHFCGQALQFDFSARLNDQGEAQGIITCTAADPLSNAKRRQVDTLEFKPNRTTNFGDALTLEYAAVDFVLLCLEKLISNPAIPGQ